jgi:hypothetical protein
LRLFEISLSSQSLQGLQKSASGNFSTLSNPKSQHVMGPLTRADRQETFNNQTGERASPEFATDHVTHGRVNETWDEVRFLELDIYMTICREIQIESRKIREEQNKTNS